MWILKELATVVVLCFFYWMGTLQQRLDDGTLFSTEQPIHQWRVSKEGTKYHLDCIDKVQYIITQDAGIALTHESCDTQKSTLGFKEL